MTARDDHPFPKYSPARLRRRKAIYGRVGRVWRRLPLARSLYRRILDRLELRIVEVPVRDLAEGFRGYTIAWLSDLHAGTFLDGETLAGVARRVTAARPDLVALGGDYINYHDEDLDALEPVVRALRARDGVVAIPGNHEYYARDPDALLRRLGTFGARVLRNAAVRVLRGGAGLWIVGTDDGERGRFDLDAALRGVNHGEPRVLLSHQPDALPLAADRGIELVLSGHTHGGQVRFPFVGAVIHHTKGGFVQGLYRRGDTTLYVGRGVGAAIVPIRFNCPPEVPLVRLVPAPRA